MCRRFSRIEKNLLAHHYMKIALRFCRAKLCKPSRALVKMYSHLQKAKMRLAFFQTSRTMKTGKPLANDYTLNNSPNKKERPTLDGVSRVVLKVGSGVLVGDDGLVDQSKIAEIANLVSGLRQRGKEVIIVTSGAVAAGFRTLGHSERPRGLSQLQMSAAVGQVALMGLYQKSLQQEALAVAQVLLTHDVFESHNLHLNVRRCLLGLLKAGVVAVINENDTVSVDELKFGDNDRLAALAAALIGADLLVLLTTVDGLFLGDVKKPENLLNYSPNIERDFYDYVTEDQGKNSAGRDEDEARCFRHNHFSWGDVAYLGWKKLQ